MNEPLPTIASAKSLLGVAARYGDRDTARRARRDLNAAVIASHITDRTQKGGITAAGAVALKSLIDLAVTR